MDCESKRHTVRVPAFLSRQPHENCVSRQVRRTVMNQAVKYNYSFLNQVSCARIRLQQRERK
jgi:hypothetical protein